MQGLIAKAELSDADKEHLSDRLLQVKKGMTITVQYFHADTVYAPLGTYESLTGTVARIDPAYREIVIAKRELPNSLSTPLLGMKEGVFVGELS